MIYLNTKLDFFHCLEQDVPSAVKTLQAILDDRFAWKLTQVLAKKEDGVDDDTHMVQESEEDYLQFELLEDENALLFKLGFTVEEAQAIIDDPYKALAEYEKEHEAGEE